MNSKNIKTASLLSAIILLITLTGCGGGMGGFFKGKTDNIETYNFRQGIDSVSIQFIEGMPPSQVFIGTDFSTGLKLKNTGAFDISGNAEVTISVPDASAFNFKEGNKKQFVMRGKSLYIKEGEEEVMTFPMKALCFPGYAEQIVRNYTRKIKATACYYYETTANADLCIDTRKFLRAEKERSECQMRDLILSGGQGGPVGVSRLSPTVIPQSTEEVTVQLAISIDKLKGADYNIFHPDAGCADPQQLNRVQVSVEMGGEPLECRPSEIQLKERQSVSMICEKKVNPSLGAFLSPVMVNMRYYVNQIQLKDITVEPPPLEYGQTVNCASIGGAQAGAATTTTTTTSGGRGDGCSSTYPGRSCRTVTCNPDESIGVCASRLGCTTGLCPGGDYNICCP
ncbi:MAG: hypothetical protein KKD17_07070 [Nanoarchaeota archaeon]|nr:hypothetical protein [Nanoarchaeota archaeon]